MALPTKWLIATVTPYSGTGESPVQLLVTTAPGLDAAAVTFLSVIQSVQSTVARQGKDEEESEADSVEEIPLEDLKGQQQGRRD